MNQDYDNFLIIVFGVSGLIVVLFALKVISAFVLCIIGSIFAIMLLLFIIAAAKNITPNNNNVTKNITKTVATVKTAVTVAANIIDYSSQLQSHISSVIKKGIDKNGGKFDGAVFDFGYGHIIYIEGPSSSVGKFFKSLIGTEEYSVKYYINGKLQCKIKVNNKDELSLLIKSGNFLKGTDDWKIKMSQM